MYKKNKRIVCKLYERYCCCSHTMAQHKCHRLGCDERSKNGPKVKCIKCGNMSYLLCFGFDKGEKIDGLDTVIMRFPGGRCMSTFTSCLSFACCTEEPTMAQLKEAMKLPKSRSNSISRQVKEKDTNSDTNESNVANELNGIKQLLSEIKKATDANTMDIAEIKSLSTKTEANVKKVTEQNDKLKLSSIRSVNRGEPSTPSSSYAQLLRSNLNTNYPSLQSPKRRRTETQSKKMNVPEPKQGTKSNASGLAIVTKPNGKRDNPTSEKTKFEKAIWVSRMDPNMTSDEMADWVTKNTPVNDRSKLNVHKLVKKDQDLSTLKFVSFKIEMNKNEFDILYDPDSWPVGVMMREFVQNVTFGDYMPDLNSKNKMISESMEKMDTTEKQSSSQVETPHLTAPAV